MSKRKKERLKRFINLVDVPEGGDSCWIWKGAPDSKGYGRITIRGIAIKAHRLSYELFRGESGELLVCHSCDTPICVNPRHLFLGTRMDNVADKIKKGRHVKGEDANLSKLTEGQVLEIRALWREKGLKDARQGYRGKEGELNYSKIAKIYNITRKQASNIIQRKNWKHVA